jgi:hypothetical protein
LLNGTLSGDRRPRHHLRVARHDRPHAAARLSRAALARAMVSEVARATLTTGDVVSTGREKGRTAVAKAYATSRRRATVAPPAAASEGDAR